MKKAKTWVKEKVLGVAGTIITATVLATFGLKSNTPLTVANPNTPEGQLQAEAQKQLSGAVDKVATKAREALLNASKTEMDAVKKVAGEELAKRGFDTSAFQASNDPDAPGRFTPPANTDRYGNSIGGNSLTTKAAPTGAGTDNYRTTGAGNTATTSGSTAAGNYNPNGGFPSNTAATVAANASSRVNATPTSAQTPATQNSSTANGASGIPGSWEQWIYSPEAKQWYFGGIFRISQSQQGYGLEYLDTTQPRPVFIAIPGLSNVSLSGRKCSFEVQQAANLVMRFELEQTGEDTMQGYSYQNGTQHSANAWRRAK